MSTETIDSIVTTLIPKLQSLTHLKQLQSHLITLGHSNTQFLTFKLIRFSLLSLSNVSYARSIFDSTNSPNVYLYTAMITAYGTSVDTYRESVLLYRDMIRKGSPRVNHFVYPHVLKCSSGSMRSTLTQKSILRVGVGGDTDVSSGSMGITLTPLNQESVSELGVGEGGDFLKCSSELRGTEKRNSVGYTTDCVHVQVLKRGYNEYLVIQTALIDAYLRCGVDVLVVRELFDEMCERNVVTWTAMVSGCARAGMIGSMMELFEEMPERDVPAWNSVISGCTQNGFLGEGVSLFRRMVESKDRPNEVSVVCLLSALGQLGMLMLGRGVHAYVCRNDIGKSYLVPNALVDMYGKCGSLIEARRVFDVISNRNLTSWNSMINCLAFHGKSEGAISTFEEMVRCGGEVRPDGITFVGLLNACTHGGLVKQGYMYFNTMIHDYLIEPEIEHYGCVIDLLGRAGKFKEVLKIIRSMKIDPDEVIWGSLLNACKLHGCLDLAELAVERLIEIDPSNVSYGLTLANIYGELGKWDKVGKVRKILNEQRVQKTPGCSWIEIDKQVHQFSSADTTHSKSEGIYRMLDIFGGII